MTGWLDGVVATREGRGQRSQLVYHCMSGQDLRVVENTEKVDGIGGVTWEGALVLSRYLEMLFALRRGNYQKTSHLVELGAGCGLVGILAAGMGCAVTITDRYTDLAEENLERNGVSGNVSAVPLDWAQACRDGELQRVMDARGMVDLVCGAEIACLRKQHKHLVSTIDAMVGPNSEAVVLLTFDGVPLDNLPTSVYEREFIERMHEHKFLHTTVFAGNVQWDSSGNACQTGVFQDNTSQCQRGSSRLDFPLEEWLVETSTQLSRGGGWKETNGGEAKRECHPLPPPPPTEANCGHHIVAFYRPSALRTCQHCHLQFLSHSLMFPCHGCRRHRGLYVCRFHPAELRCSVSGLGDRLGYYGTGEEGYAAAFWDCCGAEEKQAPGCVAVGHEPY